MRNNKQIKLIADVGFNAGISSEIFLKSREDIYVYSFDIMEHEYSKYGKEYIDVKYPFRHLLIQGDTTSSVINFYNVSKDLKFDLVFIDGGHSYDVAYKDIYNFSKFATKNTILIIDDLGLPSVVAAYNDCIAEGIITSGKIFKSKHKKWVQCKYLKKND